MAYCAALAYCSAPARSRTNRQRVQGDRLTESMLQQSVLQAVQSGLAIPPDSAAEVAAELEAVTCRGGDWLFRQGDEADGLYLLARGRLQVWIERDPTADGTSPRLVAEVSPGETVGEIGMLAGGARSAGIRAVRDSLLLRMNSAAFDRLARQRPGAHAPHSPAGSPPGCATAPQAARTAARGVRTVALVPLDDGPAARDLVKRLAAALRRTGPVRVLTARSPAEAGAGAPGHAGGATQDCRRRWSTGSPAQEDAAPLRPLRGRPGATPWSDLALRHADLILLVGRGRSRDPAPRAWEGTLLDEAACPRRTSRAGAAACRQPAGTLLGTRRVAAPTQARFSPARALRRAGRPRAAGTHPRRPRRRPRARWWRRSRLCAPRRLSRADGGRHRRSTGSAARASAAVMAAGMAHGTCRRTMSSQRARKAFVDGKPFGDVTVPIISLLRGRRMERLIDDHLPGEIEDLPLPFFCVSSNLGNGHACRCTTAARCRARCARACRCPGIFPPAVIDGQLAVDGGILDNLPVDLHARPARWARHRRRRELAEGLHGRLRLRAVAVGVARRAVRCPCAALSRAEPVVADADGHGDRRDRLGASGGPRADLLVRPPVVGGFSLTDVRLRPRSSKSVIAKREGDRRRLVAAG